MLNSQAKSPIPRWESVIGSWKNLSHMVREQRRSGLPKKIAIVSSGKEIKVVGGKKRCLLCLSFCFRELKFLPVPEEPVTLELKNEELPDCCHITGQPDELIHSLNIDTVLVMYFISQGLCENSYSRRAHALSVSCLSAGAEFYY